MADQAAEHAASTREAGLLAWQRAQRRRGRDYAALVALAQRVIERTLVRMGEALGAAAREGRTLRHVAPMVGRRALRRRITLRRLLFPRHGHAAFGGEEEE
eukprot:8806765-Alexandrium_andersonii.AAC.1